MRSERSARVLPRTQSEPEAGSTFGKFVCKFRPGEQRERFAHPQVQPSYENMSGTQKSRASTPLPQASLTDLSARYLALTDINPNSFFAHAFGQAVSAAEGCLDEYQDHAGSSRRTLCVFHSPAGIPVTAPMTTATAKAFQPTHPSARNTVTAAPAMHRAQSGMNISLQPCFMIFLHQKYE